MKSSVPDSTHGKGSQDPFELPHLAQRGQFVKDALDSGDARVLEHLPELRKEDLSAEGFVPIAQVLESIVRTKVAIDKAVPVLYRIMEMQTGTQLLIRELNPQVIAELKIQVKAMSKAVQAIESLADAPSSRDRQLEKLLTTLLRWENRTLWQTIVDWLKARLDLRAAQARAAEQKLLESVKPPKF